MNVVHEHVRRERRAYLWLGTMGTIALIVSQVWR